ncbi:MAG TPA: carboxy terminal-processing peptidase [Gammaproteobacteria bacterium]|jgi:carboxyl-terminal processing protease|nr:carboxy terminal-processing peptidase [Gammaproteobacteria bacterium]
MHRKRKLIRKLNGVLLVASAVLTLALATPGHAVPDESVAASTAQLESNQRHYQVARLVTKLSERAHYTKTRIDNELSIALLKNYIEGLDNNRSFFLAPDINAVNRYRYSLDNSLRSGDMDPVFSIFRIYRERVKQHFDFAFELLKVEPDLTIDETFVFDRSEMPWAASELEMQDVWRKRVKNDLLTLLLADPDKTWEKASETLRKRYERYIKRVDALDSDDVFEGFMDAFAGTLDPHSNYMSPRQSEEYRIHMSLSYQGIGASLQLEDDMVTVLNVIPGGPAAIDGRLKATDHIIGIAQGANGEMVDVIGWMLDDVVQLIRGPAETIVMLQIRPGDSLPGENEYTLDLTRNKIKLEEQAAQSEVLEISRDGQNYRVGVISVPSFYQDFDARGRGEVNYTSTSRDVERLLGELKEKGINGLVIDLRGNGGGHLTEATALSGLFIHNGPVVQLRDTTGKIDVLEDPIPSQIYDGPLVVLVNRFSASASEIFAAAIQDYNRGIVIGQQTFGKGTVQNLYVLDQYAPRSNSDALGQLTLTIGKYYRVTGGSTQNRGVIPDIELPSLVDTSQFGENTKPRALPWDQINPTRYRALSKLDMQVSELTRSQIQRSAMDPNFQYLLQDIESIEELRKQKAISLNLETRKLEQEERHDERLVRENNRRQELGLEPLESFDTLKDEEPPDVLLNQAAEILTDMATLSGAGQTPVLSRAQ